jgi:hypothetical protein
MSDQNDFQLMLDAVTDEFGDLADVRGYIEPKNRTYQIFCAFKYPLGALAIDEHFNRLWGMLGANWSIKLTVEQVNEKTVARLSALLRYGDDKVAA